FMAGLRRVGRLRARLYSMLEVGPMAGRLAAAINWFLIRLIVAGTVLESVPRLASAYCRLFNTVEYVALSVFSIEYLARVWTALEHPPSRRVGGIESRMH